MPPVLEGPYRHTDYIPSIKVGRYFPGFSAAEQTMCAQVLINSVPVNVNSGGTGPIWEVAPMSPPTGSGRMTRKRSFRAHFLDRRASTQTLQTEPFLETKVCITRLENQEIRLPTLGLASTECKKMPLSI